MGGWREKRKWEEGGTSTSTMMSFITSVRAVRDAITHFAQVNTHVCPATLKLVGGALRGLGLVTYNTNTQTNTFNQFKSFQGIHLVQNLMIE